MGIPTNVLEIVPVEVAQKLTLVNPELHRPEGFLVQPQQLE